MERVALKVAVSTGLKLAERTRRLEVAVPRLVPADSDGEVSATCRYGEHGVRLGIVVGLTATDVIANVALESHDVRGWVSGRTGDPRLIRPTGRRCGASEGKQHTAKRSRESHWSSFSVPWQFYPPWARPPASSPCHLNSSVFSNQLVSSRSSVRISRSAALQRGRQLRRVRQRTPAAP